MRTTFVILSLLAAACARAASPGFTGLEHAAVRLEAGQASGLEGVYVVSDTRGAYATYPSATARWSSFGASGAAYATPLEAEVRDGMSTVPLPLYGGGLIVEDGGQAVYFWVADYAAKPVDLRGLAAAEADSEADACEFLALTLDGSAAPMYYYTINGRRVEIDRGLEVTYTTLVYDSEAGRYVEAEHTVELPSAGATLRVPAPLCDTRVRLEGDRFLRVWGEEQAVETAGTVRATAVAAATSAEQQTRDVPNEQRPDGDGSALGGSAPCEITFSAEVTDAVAFSEWQVSRSPDFDIVERSYNERAFATVFDEEGTFYVRFTAANAEGTCSAEGEVYTVAVGTSVLTCPNAFTPYTSPGVNDEWRVSYRSITEFRCEIFNRWGTRVALLTDPSQGWDGRHGGRRAGAGVYYYVVRARGADGKEYRLSGDINIIGSRERGSNVAE